MKASSCFVIICAILVSSDLALGFSFGIRQYVAVKKPDSEAAPSEDAMIPITDDLVKKAEERFAKMQESVIRNFNGQGTEESLLQNLQNKTTKQLKIMGNKLIQTEEKVVSLGTKDNATIAIYKLINIRPLNFNLENEAEKSTSNQTENAEQVSETPDKSSNEPESEPKAEPSENTQSPAENQTSSQNDQSNTQVQADQPAQNESAQNEPMVAIMGPDGIPKPIHGIAIRVGPKSDGTQGKDVAFQFFK